MTGASGFTVAIVGRPNVGKSTLFNRLVGKRLALVDDTPGVTRDIREGVARLADMRFTLLDTAGLEDVNDDSLPGRMRRMTERAAASADLCLFVIDARAGVTAVDQEFAGILRRGGKPVLLLANKAEGRAGEGGALEAFALGLGDPIAVSSEHGEGFEDLLTALRPHYDAACLAEDAADAVETDVLIDADDDADAGAPDPLKPVQIAVVGRPNAGKSTLINRLLGEERLLTGPEAGVTRDAIGLPLDWNGRAFKIFDTAGLRKKARVQDKLEKLSVGDALRAVRYAEVVILLIDVRAAFEQQDLRIADLAEREGRAVVVAANKWDLEDEPQAKLVELKQEFERLLPQLRGAPLVAVSGLTGRGLDRLQKAVLSAYDAWNIRISTGKLNRWLAHQTERHPPPAPSGRRIRLRYMTQAKTRPPTFVVFASRPDALPESYLRFLANGLREDFALHGAPIRILIRAGDNPYASKAAKR
ncbi:MAG: ribosome biogenesis GTPase Der [Pseudomonadota bacterium]